MATRNKILKPAAFLGALVVGLIVGTISLNPKIAMDALQSDEGEISDVADTVRLAPSEPKASSSSNMRSASSLSPSADTGTVDQENSGPRLVYATDTLHLERAESEGKFLGYRVMSDDPEHGLNTGDIITAIDSNPVEDSPAGTELLIAALMNPDAEMTVIPADD